MKERYSINCNFSALKNNFCLLNTLPFAHKLNMVFANFAVGLEQRDTRIRKIYLLALLCHKEYIVKTILWPKIQVLAKQGTRVEVISDI